MVAIVVIHGDNWSSSDKKSILSGYFVAEDCERFSVIGCRGGSGETDFLIL